MAILLIDAPVAGAVIGVVIGPQIIIPRIGSVAVTIGRILIPILLARVIIVVAVMAVALMIAAVITVVIGDPRVSE